jgi:hypothetical protein
MRYVVWLMVLILVIVHQDFWNWNDGTLVFGFMPIGLFYQVCISLAASFIWFLACHFAWPADVEDDVVDNVSQTGETDV